ncbi:MAG: zinc ribbon domain-containing protein [Dehalococcoidia bacterium]|nr:zinc ribbon domain-containing protein [Dehalococcoidia bacterium]
MPTYDFKCPHCNLQFEVSRSFSQSSTPAKCPIDGTEATRVFTMPTTFTNSGTSDLLPPPPPPGAGHGHTHGPGTHTH